MLQSLASVIAGLGVIVAILIGAAVVKVLASSKNIGKKPLSVAPPRAGTLIFAAVATGIAGFVTAAVGKQAPLGDAALLAVLLLLLQLLPSSKDSQQPSQWYRLSRLAVLPLCAMGGGFVRAIQIGQLTDPEGTDVSVSSDTGLLILAGLFVLFVHFIPTIVAIKRKHPHLGMIVGANVITGWTGLGWLVCLAWALWTPRRIVVPVTFETPGVSRTGEEASKLRELTQLRNEALITDHEFQVRRAAILSRLT